MRFWKNESGAVTVDWVVLSAAAIGLGGAAVSSVQEGLTVSGLSIADQLESASSGIYYDNVLSSSDFSNGLDGWAGTTTRNVNGFGWVLGPISSSNGAEIVQKTFEIPEGTEHARLEFDLLALDSLDNTPNTPRAGVGEGPVLYVDGIEVARATIDSEAEWRVGGGQLTEWTFHDLSDVGIKATLLEAGDLGAYSGAAGHTDSRTRVQITVDNPSAEITMGLGVVSNQSFRDESVAIDNFSLTIPSQSADDGEEIS